MSRNLVEIVRRHHEVEAPTALAVLEEAMARRGEPAARSVLPGGGPQLLATGRDREGLEHALATMTPEQLLAHVTEAELRGRGGAGFPAGVKWTSARDAPGERRFIVANADEGDPAILSVS